MRKIILASGSPRRSELLKQIGISFSVVPSGVEEDMNIGLRPEELVQELSFSKALDVAARFTGQTLVIGADTVVVKDEVLGKPQDESHAFSMLKSLQGDWHEVITGISLVETPGLRSLKGFERTRVKMRSMTDDFIYSYIKTREPMDKAGAYGIQGMGALLVEKIDGCYFNVVGLPLMKLSRMLEEFDVRLL